ncbi:hypothetical protein [Spiribacter onubensis]|uniref:Uncharacterized protein n=1 Tax=Spiribacter onubensis TaxID=3122420 RepID=A0ABV3S8C7_9GAMM
MVGDSMGNDCGKDWGKIRSFGIFSTSVGGLAGLISGDGLILFLSLIVAAMMLALRLNEEMRESQQSGDYKKGWERWGAG